ncbi:DUF3820 family protein [Psychroflexus sp. CAK57W]|uniref:DUF3820 family protein n=1 Tax=Psychroflexus curvus TaxID=2873595 RepID=UPI001CD01726|nr:DUF3820 family protein [Psychroflexus curvus]MBZ9627983.1 DUF3820 family protein [Psychroflexus curvus]MBZ9787681.1 DUF3820 family protein [Psychroflexus curvus]
MNSESHKKALVELAHAKMHFGKYKGFYLSDIPEYYLIWYKRKGFPDNKLGQQMQEVLELKENGLEYILRKIRKS